VPGGRSRARRAGFPATEPLTLVSDGLLSRLRRNGDGPATFCATAVMRPWGTFGSALARSRRRTQASKCDRPHLPRERDGRPIGSAGAASSYGSGDVARTGRRDDLLDDGWQVAGGS
jgi:hypothetical protein